MLVCQVAVIVCLCLIAGSLALNVLLRFAFNFALTGADGFAQVSMVWLAMVCMPLGLYLSEHVAFDFIQAVINKKTEKVLTIIVLLVVLSTCAILIYFSGPFLETGFRQTFPSMQWMSKGYAYIAVPIGLAMTAFVAIVEILNILSGTKVDRNLPLHNFGGGDLPEQQ